VPDKIFAFEKTLALLSWMRFKTTRKVVIGSVISICFVLSTMLVVFRQSVLSALGQFLSVSESPEKADLIYVLAGDFLGSRVLVGAELGARGYAKKVLLGGGPYQNSYQSDLAIPFAMQHGYPPHLFVPVRLLARSTIEEAIELGPMFRTRGAKRIILVTSNYHARRASLVFRLFLPDLCFSTVSAPDKSFDPKCWWQNQQNRKILFTEYWKMLGTLFTKAGLLPVHRREATSQGAEILTRLSSRRLLLFRAHFSTVCRIPCQE
jgi:uncharacterized SAM-binding protein YcdF (DUF218 family)